MRPSEITLGEAFLAKEIDVEGDIFSVFDVAEHIFQCPHNRLQGVSEKFFWLFSGVLQRWENGKQHSIDRDQAVISYH
jgi:hypothetical protein